MIDLLVCGRGLAALAPNVNNNRNVGNAMNPR